MTVDTNPGLNQDFRQQEIPGSNEVLYLPKRWLNPDERKDLLLQLFSPQERLKIQQAGEINRHLLTKSDGIIVTTHHQVNGFLGDIIEQSRLLGLLEKLYPQKVYADFHLPHFIGNARTIQKVASTHGEKTVVWKETPESSLVTTTLHYPVMIDAETINIHFVKPYSDQDDNETLISLDQNRGIHLFHQLQVIWEQLYQTPIDQLPEPEIIISEEAKEKASRVFDELQKSPDFNLIIHPDAHHITWSVKKWPLEKWENLLVKISQRNKNCRLFIHKASHRDNPTEPIIEFCKQKHIPIQLLPFLELDEFAALLSKFPKEKTLFLGLESMPGSHLAPALDLQSIVIAGSELSPIFFGPWGGFVAAAKNGLAKKVEVSTVLYAVELAKQKLEMGR